MKKQDLLDRIEMLETQRAEVCEWRRQHLANKTMPKVDSLHHTKKLREREEQAYNVLADFAGVDAQALEVRDHLPDLICNLLHLATACDMDAYDSMASALRNYEAEQREAEKESEALEQSAQNSPLLREIMKG